MMKSALPSILFFLALAAVGGCNEADGGMAPGDDDGKADDPGDSGDPGSDGLAVCAGRAFTPDARTSWRHGILTPLVTAAGAANHSAQDVVSTLDGGTLLPGKFSYGTISKDLEDEDVAVFLDECDDWHRLGVFTTNGDGRIAAAVPDALPPGQYEARFQVLGDGSTTTSFLWVLPAGTHLVVTDIDGTLTSSDSELFKQILDGTHVPEPYPGAADLTNTHATAGWIVVYLTGRPYLLTRQSRAWLSDLAFAAGPVHLTDSATDALPTESAVGAYKRAYLEGLIDAGYILDLAYGNASTDISAYLGTGLDPDQVWIIGPNGGDDGTHAVAGSWVPRAAEVATLPTPDQPY